MFVFIIIILKMLMLKRLLNNFRLEDFWILWYIFSKIILHTGAVINFVLFYQLIW